MTFVACGVGTRGGVESTPCRMGGVVLCEFGFGDWRCLGGGGVGGTVALDG